jgi:hypothetical protein
MGIKQGVLRCDNGAKFQLGDRVFVNQIYKKSYSLQGAHRTPINIEERAGIVVGVKMKPLLWRYEGDDEGYYYTMLENKYVLEVNFYVDLNSVDVPIEGCRLARYEENFELIKHPGLSRQMKEEYEKNKKYFPRDEKGRFVTFNYRDIG